MTPAGKLPISEAQFQGQVIGLASKMGWKCYHTHDSRRSTAGWPELALLKGGRLVMAELKSEMGFATSAQREWLAGLDQVAGVEAYLWKPDDLDEIAAVLSHAGAQRG